MLFGDPECQMPDAVGLIYSKTLIGCQMPALEIRRALLFYKSLLFEMLGTTRSGGCQACYLKIIQTSDGGLKEKTRRFRIGHREFGFS